MFQVRSIGLVEIDVPQHAVDPAELILDLMGVFSALGVDATEKYIFQPLPRHHHLGILSGALGKEPVGNSATNELNLVGLHVVNDLGYQSENLFGG